MHILFFTKGDHSVPSSRVRVWSVAERLSEQYGWNYEVLHSFGYSLFSFSYSRFKILFDLTYNLQLTTYNFLFVHKSLFPWDVVLLILAAKKLFHKKLVYDMDDAEWIHSPKKSKLLARHADAVFCGSHEILNWAKQYNTNSVFMPTVLDADVYGSHAVAHADGGILTIGWVGQGKLHFKAGNFAVLQGAFQKLAERGLRFRFVLVGAQNYQPLKDMFSKSSYKVVYVDDAEWIKEDAMPNLIQQYQFDVGVMPLSNTLFNRAKCGYKAIEYMACGAPVVASPVGEANYIIKNNINGFLADTPEEWASALEKLLQDASLRKRMGVAGRKLVEERYSYQTIVPRIHAELVKIQ